MYEFDGLQRDNCFEYSLEKLAEFRCMEWVIISLSLDYLIVETPLRIIFDEVDRQFACLIILREEALLNLHEILALRVEFEQLHEMLERGDTLHIDFPEIPCD